AGTARRALKFLSYASVFQNAIRRVPGKDLVVDSYAAIGDWAEPYFIVSARTSCIFCESQQEKGHQSSDGGLVGCHPHSSRNAGR
ncbi:MAG: hypothetical protein WAK55_22865, partial [Xanthobacteraceae bacterium]